MNVDFLEKVTLRNASSIGKECTKRISKDMKYIEKMKALKFYTKGKVNSFQVYLRGQEKVVFQYRLQLAMKEIVLRYFHDIIKAPMGNPGKPSFSSLVSHNIYFGVNVELKSNGIVTRTAYGTGSGSSSIGLDPRKSTIYPIFPELAHLVNVVEKIVIQEYQKKNVTMPFNINFVSVKVYYTGKVTREHTDMEFTKKTHVPKANNSQEMGTPVAIVTFGDSKILEFVRYFSDESGNQERTKEVLKFVQDNCSIVVHDPNDEYLDHNRNFWKHKASLVDGDVGVSVSLCFREVRATKDVMVDDCTFANKNIGGTGKKLQQYLLAEEFLANNNVEYTAMVNVVNQKVQSRLESYFWQPRHRKKKLPGQTWFYKKNMLTGEETGRNERNHM